MFLAGLWVGFVGYWIAYAGVAKLSGDTGCTLGRAIRGQCTPGSSGVGGAAVGGPGVTRRYLEHEAHDRQVRALPRTPLFGAVA